MTHLRSYTKNSCLVAVSRHLETITALGLQPHAFICFSVYGYPDEAFTLVIDILLKLKLINK